MEALSDQLITEAGLIGALLFVSILFNVHLLRKIDGMHTENRRVDRETTKQLLDGLAVIRDMREAAMSRKGGA